MFWSVLFPYSLKGSRSDVLAGIFHASKYTPVPGCFFMSAYRTGRLPVITADMPALLGGDLNLVVSRPDAT